jgi:hypothetical protein
MYFLDPDRGRRRRALVRDQAIHLSRQLACHWDKAIRDLDHRLSGVAAGFQNLTHSQPVSDEVLEERVRSKLGRSVSHPRAIEISVRDGRVTLRGPVLAAEAQSAFNAVRWVPGVNHVENEMELHAEPGNISALQGVQTGVGSGNATWPPAACLGAAAGGLAAMIFGLPRPTSLTGLLTGLGLALAATSESRSVVARRNSRTQPATPSMADGERDVVPLPRTTDAPAERGPPRVTTGSAPAPSPHFPPQV